MPKQIMLEKNDALSVPHISALDVSIHAQFGLDMP